MHTRIAAMIDIDPNDRHVECTHIGRFAARPGFVGGRYTDTHHP